MHLFLLRILENILLVSNLLDKRLSFDHHLKEKFSTANRGICLITRLRKYLQRKTLLCVYKLFVRPHLDYGEYIFDNSTYDSFTQKLASVQYNACLAITGCFRGPSRCKIYQELGLESLSDGRWLRILVFFYKIVNKQTTPYFLNFFQLLVR